MKGAVLFDLDGTLLHTPRAIVAEMRSAVAEVTGADTDSQTVRSLVGLPLDLMCLRLAAHAGHEHAAGEVRMAYLRRFRSEVLPRAAALVCDGVIEGLRHLTSQGFRTGVVTNKSRTSAEAILNAAGLLGLLEVVIGADDVTRPKPEPDAIRLALKQLGASPGSSIYVGDTAGDMTAARAAGVRAVGVTYGVGTTAELEVAGAQATATDFPAVIRMAAADRRDSRGKVPVD